MILWLDPKRVPVIVIRASLLPLSGEIALIEGAAAASSPKTTPAKASSKAPDAFQPQGHGRISASHGNLDGGGKPPGAGRARCCCLTRRHGGLSGFVHPTGFATIR